MNKELKEITNIGVPVYSPITLKPYDMTISCSDDKTKAKKVLEEAKEEAKNRVGNKLGVTTDNNKVNYLRFINFFANNNSSSVFDLDEIQKILNTYRELGQFERKPIIELAKEIKDKYLELQEISEYIWKNKYTSEIHSRLRKDFPAIYFGQDFFKKEMRNYFRRETTLYARGLYNLDGIANIDFSDLVDEYTNTLDPEKVSLYVAYQYIKQLREAVALKDAFKAQEAVFYLTAYLDLRINKDKSIIANRDCIDNNYVKRELKTAFEEMPILRKINYDRSFFENKPLEDNKNIIDTLLNIENLVVSESFVKKGRKTVNSASDKTKIRREAASEEELEEIAKMLADKEYEYLKHNPIAQIDCHNKFSNYKAFVYENGMVPADRFKGIHHMDLSKQDAIYVFDATNFEDMIKYNKQELMGIIPRMYHSKTWKERIEQIATEETQEYLYDAAMELTRKKIY